MSRTLMGFLAPIACVSTIVLVGYESYDETPEPSKITRHVAYRDEHNTICISLADGKSPVRDGAIEGIISVDAGERSESDTRVVAAMIQKSNDKELMYALAQSMYDYACAYEVKELSTLAVDLIGEAKQNFIGNNWTTAIVAGNEERTKVGFVDRLSCAYVQNSGRGLEDELQLVAFDGTGKIYEVDADELYNLAFEGVAFEDMNLSSFKFDGSVLDKLINRGEGSFLVRTGGAIVLSDGATSVAAKLRERTDEGEMVDDKNVLEFDAQFSGSTVLAALNVDDYTVDPEEVHVITGNPDTLEGLRYERKSVDQVAGARELFASAA